MTVASPARDDDPIRATVRRALPPRGTLVVAVSGGLDSMVLLDAIAAPTGRRGEIVVATFDHASGPHSTRASSFVARRAAAYRLPVVCGRGAPTRVPSEASWREARWHFLDDVARATRGTIVTAHTRDDQVETVLIRVLRDAGARGLAGLYAESDRVRPLLGFTRAELHAYAHARGLPWREDPSNRSANFLRNRARRDLLPALRRARPSIDEDLLAIARDAADWRRELARRVDEVIDLRIRRGRGDVALDVAAESLRGYSREELAIVWPEIAMRAGLALDRRGTLRAAEFTTRGRTGGRIQLSGGWEIDRARDRFELHRCVSSSDRDSADGGAESGEQPLRARLTWDRWSFTRAAASEPVRHDPWIARLPANRPLRVRSWRPGDRMLFRGASGVLARKVRYFLSDAGISGHIRSRWPVILSGEEIVWIPGVRRSDAATERSGWPVVTYVCDYLDR